MGLGVLQMIGSINTNTSGALAPYEEWSCSVSLITDPAADFAALLGTFQNVVGTWFNAFDSAISPTCSLDYLKFNEFNVTTGKQITDPSLVFTYTTPVRGGGSATVLAPTGTSYRISLDDETRNRRARGGFYVPRTTLPVLASGRFDATKIGLAKATAITLIDGLNTTTSTVGVWSRTDHAVTASSRMRIGDVPDNVSRRRNEMREQFQSSAII